MNIYRSNRGGEAFVYYPNGKFSFFFVVCGSARLSSEESENIWLREADSLLIPGGMTFSLTEMSDDLKLFELLVPAN
ncbi:MAG: hypothetical protein CL398_03685 [Acidiferrobacteraceae bacterium]|nr:hypothetical protein [Acidiferrobacteraceae bacterium]